jgi:hypothetical protein
MQSTLRFQDYHIASLLIKQSNVRIMTEIYFAKSKVRLIADRNFVRSPNANQCREVNDCRCIT